MTITDANGCTAADSITITAIEPVIANRCAIRHLGYGVELSCLEPLAVISLYDLRGKVLFRTEGPMTMVVVPIPAHKGLYILQAIGMDGFISNK